MSHDQTTAPETPSEPLCQAIAAVDAIRRSPAGLPLSASGVSLVEAADRLQIHYQGTLLANASSDSSEAGVIEAIAGAAQARCRAMLTDALRDLGGCIVLPEGHFLHADIENQVMAIGRGSTPCVSIVMVAKPDVSERFHVEFRIGIKQPRARVVFAICRPGRHETAPRILQSAKVSADNYRDLVGALCLAYSSILDRHLPEVHEGPRRLH